MHCLILAGGQISPEDSLYRYSSGAPKALIDVGGRTMLEWVVDAIQGSQAAEEVVVIGLDSDDIGERALTFTRPVHFLPDAGGLVPNVLAGTDWILRQWPGVQLIIGSSADIPAITASTVDGFVSDCRPLDRGVYYNFVTRQTMEARFPGSKRTYSQVNSLEVAGGDMVLVRADLIAANRQLLESLANARKQPWRVASTVGLGVLLKYLLHRLTFAEIEQIAGRILGVPGQVILSERAELAMDADKPMQVEQLRVELESRQRNLLT